MTLLPPTPHARASVAAVLACAALGAALVACDPGTVCTPKPGAPSDPDPCDPAQWNGPVGADGGVDTGRSPDSDGVADDVPGDGADSGGRDEDYPAGPYGVREGDTIANLSLPTAGGETFSFGDALADPAVRLVLVSTAAGWCTACREEQPALVKLHRDFAARGLLVVVALFEDDFGSPATPAYAEGWRRQYGLPFPLVLDARNQFGAFYDSDLAPMNLFVDGSSGRILSIGIGFDEAVARALVADRLR